MEGGGERLIADLGREWLCGPVPDMWLLRPPFLGNGTHGLAWTRVGSRGDVRARRLAGDQNCEAMLLAAGPERLRQRPLARLPPETTRAKKQRWTR